MYAAGYAKTCCGINKKHPKSMQGEEMSSKQMTASLQAEKQFQLLMLQMEGCAGILNIPAIPSLLAAFQYPNGAR